MADVNTAVSEAIVALADEEHKIATAEMRAEDAEAIAARAVAQVDAAEEYAANVMKSAMETALGQRIETLEAANASLKMELEAWKSSALSQLREELVSALMPIVELAEEILREPATEETPASSTPPASETLTPEALTEESSGKSAAPTKPKRSNKTARWI